MQEKIEAYYSSKLHQTSLIKRQRRKKGQKLEPLTMH